MPEQISTRTPLVVSATFARPADTTAYTAMDAVANSTTVPAVMTLAVLVNVSHWGGGLIRRIRLTTDQAACVARFKVHFFRSTTLTLSNDNAAFKKLAANWSAKVGEWTSVALTTEGTGSDIAGAEDATLNLPFTSTDGNLYALLETLDGFTPASAQNFWLEIVVT